MEKIPTQELDSGSDLADAPNSDEDEMVRAWREEQLRRLGLLPQTSIAPDAITVRSSPARRLAG